MNGSGTRDHEGRFSGARLHVEAVPRLPAFPARWTLEDPRGRPYFVFWTASDGTLSYHLQMARLDAATVRLSTPEGRSCRIEVVHRPLPRHGGCALLYKCPPCGAPRRYLYGLRLVADTPKEDGVWRCVICAGLRFCSQGRYRRQLERAMFAACYGDLRIREPLPRHPWDPRAVSDPGMVVEEFCGALAERRRPREV